MRRLREAHKLTQPQMANRFEVGLSSYKKFELGQNYPKPEKVEKMARYFGVTMDELYTGETPPGLRKEEFTREERSIIWKFRDLTPQWKSEIAREIEEAWVASRAEQAERE